MNKNEDELSIGTWILVSLFFVVIIGIPTASVSYSLGKMSEKQKAIDANAAYYTVDEKTGRTTFQYRAKPE